MSACLQVKGVSRSFGGLRALSDISFELRPAECLGIIGPNGAGKTTLFNVISGTFPPSAGEILMGDLRLSGMRQDRIARSGVARTFQSPNMFRGVTARQNLQRCLEFQRFYSPLSFARGGRRVVDDTPARPDDVLELIGLAAQADAVAGSLPYGMQKILGVGMALMLRPRVILMDEPAAGLHPTEKAEMAGLILKIRDSFKVGVVVVEHDMKLIMGICDRVVVISHGKHVATGKPAEIQSNQAVIDAYLGTGS